MNKVKFSDMYLTSTVSVPKDTKHIYKALTVEQNTEFLEYIYNRIKSNPEILKKKPLLKSSINFKAKKTHETMYKEVQKILKKHNISFSSIYRDLYPKFVK